MGVVRRQGDGGRNEAKEREERAGEEGEGRGRNQSAARCRVIPLTLSSSPLPPSHFLHPYLEQRVLDDLPRAVWVHRDDAAFPEVEHVAGVLELVLVLDGDDLKAL